MLALLRLVHKASARPLPLLPLGRAALVSYPLGAALALLTLTAAGAGVWAVGYGLDWEWRP